MFRALIVDDDPTLRLTLRLMLQKHNLRVFEADDGEKAIAEVKSHPPGAFDLIILDVNMPRLNGLEALSQIKAYSSDSFCIVLTAFTETRDAVVAIREGAYDYLEKPIAEERLVDILRKARQARELIYAAERSSPRLTNKIPEAKDGSKWVGMVGQSAGIQKVYDVIYRLAKFDTSVMIRGESGTGKELVAKALHYNSHRKNGPFIAINCASIPENLIESELFGYDKGAFTGADKKKPGKFACAERGTLFLDEVGDMSLVMQAKLLRVLQEKVYTPLGSNRQESCNVRIVAATSRPLENMIREGQFREDLFYRLNIMPVNLPALRDRAGDIPDLVEFMIEKFNQRYDRSIMSVEDSALKDLCHYSWPGNIRELENVIEHAFILEASDIIQRSSLPDYIPSLSRHEITRVVGTAWTEVQIKENEIKLNADQLEHFPIKGNQVFNFPNSIQDLNYPQLKEEFEKNFILQALRLFDGRINQTAIHTQMTKMTLIRKLEKYGIQARDFKNTESSCGN